ncbi:MAG: DUF4390 domain-containing protein [Fidelibacterota bacterium]
MEPSLLTSLYKQIITTVITVGSLFYSTINGVRATLDPIQLETDGNQVLVSTQLVNCYSDDFDEILSSGKRIYFHLNVKLYETGVRQPVWEDEFFNAISYSHLDRIYEVYHSHTKEFLSNLTFDQAKRQLASFSAIPIISMGELDPEKEYYLKITARLDKIYLEGMDEPINLMFYWSGIPPEITSQPFTIDMLNE